MQKKRLDSLLVERGIIQSRERAKGLILSGDVSVNGNPVNKAGILVDEDAEIKLTGKDIPYVSRGGLKLEKAIKEFNINVKDKVAIDVGASTGGFTDCLLQYGVKKVYAVDVGYGQLAWKLRKDPRVVVIERKNIRYIKPSDIGEQVDIATIDVSFISLKLVLPAVKNLLKDNGEIIALIKPQFEIGKGEVGRGGVVREKEKHEKVISEIKSFAIDLGLKVLNVTESPIAGQKGNVEFLIYLQK
ncbi:MAG: RNA methyltransferase [Nitrospinae bacterium RIFCSPLOWO2_02_FULL_39_110]|nr:MAG: RNA methyltransferase [Nitrospinae bacterium RIFCSPHIGHO2_02_39_11]OGW00462.1 MAG: RNA methyltransferase [Nitrospinae bacterium RIFCSPHIGHO2_12_FULL_39_42]OGW02756.1 MAG: RNA methyltransferase [Nitrospinae bacterium RIFCSPHIGHO2_02_FULL_39_82]OGW04241.1 MAG: RNA methyltransferase [Nitrospinae bacterium RIFCSPLOWO2_02_FULL_39_110]OGW06097.1 MAG: RNA methyltransferase [Nitrospinae bacterium RIFCSPLOWO2_02_39_17]OGW09583.1 MAG: RNA methyltransferase [Nitrospinae bacterium RIFCSPLOWO2_12_F